ncbi:unnamed protein product [Somion occarium]|uniref:Uncharacterized protein n=1 Tax=Somion occarium TaxID=3059160 RepID=A0ABP1CS68_9APHY
MWFEETYPIAQYDVSQSRAVRRTLSYAVALQSGNLHGYVEIDAGRSPNQIAYLCEGKMFARDRSSIVSMADLHRTLHLKAPYLTHISQSTGKRCRIHLQFWFIRHIQLKLLSPFSCATNRQEAGYRISGLLRLPLPPPHQHCDFVHAFPHLYRVQFMSCKGASESVYFDVSHGQEPYSSVIWYPLVLILSARCALHHFGIITKSGSNEQPVFYPQAHLRSLRQHLADVNPLSQTLLHEIEFNGILAFPARHEYIQLHVFAITVNQTLNLLIITDGEAFVLQKRRTGQRLLSRLDQIQCKTKKKSPQHVPGLLQDKNGPPIIKHDGCDWSSMRLLIFGTKSTAALAPSRLSRSFC